MLGGHWMSDLSYQFAKKCKFDLVQVDGYSAYAYSDEQMAVFTYRYNGERVLEAKCIIQLLVSDDVASCRNICA